MVFTWFRFPIDKIRALKNCKFPGNLDTPSIKSKVIMATPNPLGTGTIQRDAPPKQSTWHLEFTLVVCRLLEIVRQHISFFFFTHFVSSDILPSNILCALPVD